MKANSTLQPHFEIMQQRYYTVPTIADATPSAAEAIKVAEILDDLLAIYVGDPEAEVPSFGSIFQVGPIARVAGAVCRWLATDVWADAIDVLMERSFPFESNLADEVANEKARIRLLMEIDPLAVESGEQSD